MHLCAAVLLAYVSFDVAVRQFEKYDSEPVYYMLREPEVLTTAVPRGGTVVVEWEGYYRKACPDLQYTRWLGRYVAGKEVIDKSAGGVVPASSAEVTNAAISWFSWTIPVGVPPGLYFWRSIEIAECVPGVVHRNHLDDAWFEIVDRPIDDSIYQNIIDQLKERQEL